jgi:adenosylcobinamide-GDP ribazoletransferase
VGFVTSSFAPSRGRLIADVADNLRFFTRLPLRRSDAPPDFRRIGWAAPLAGALVGAFGAAALIAGRAVGFPTLLSATLAVIVQIFATGALHEDGLADVADGFGGGRDRESKLAIMRDSRIGAYGALALAFSLLLRVEAISFMARPSAAFAAAGLILAGAVARMSALAPLAWLPPARADGAGASASAAAASVGALGARSMLPGAITLAALAAGLGLLTLEVVRALFACAIAVGVARLFVAVAKRHIGGQTGDVCGASAALGEIATLLALLIGGRDAY